MGSVDLKGLRLRRSLRLDESLSFAVGLRSVRHGPLGLSPSTVQACLHGLERSALPWSLKKRRQVVPWLLN